MDLEETLEKIVELAREELHVVRKREKEKTPARDHGKDYHEAQQAADRLDHYAHQLYRMTNTSPPSIPTLSLSQMATSAVSGSTKRLPKLISR